MKESASLARLVILNAALVALCAICGCGTDYCWRSSVPKKMRTVAVPTFRNESDVSELGAVATRQLLREFQREGTFGIRSVGNAALEVQGVVKKTSGDITGYDRTTGMRVGAYRLSAEVEVSVIDKRLRKVLVNNKVYRPVTDVTIVQDATTAWRDASGRLMEELARQVVDDLLNMKW